MSLKSFIDRNYRLRIFSYRSAVRLFVRPYLASLRVPIVAVTGTNGKTTVVRLLDRFLRASGYRVGACTTRGVSHDGRFVSTRDEAGAGGAWRAARCTGVQALVLETARGGLLDYGAGFNRCDVGVVTNVFEDHLGDRGVETLEELVIVKSAVARLTRPGGTLVLNGDDPLVRPMKNLTRAATIHFTVEGRQDAFPCCWFLREGWIWRKGDGGEHRFMSLREIPMTLGGLQRCDVANAAAALAALEGVSRMMPVQWPAAAGVLREFGLDRRENPTRNSLLEYRGAHLLVAHVKNPESARQEAALFLQLRRAGGYGKVVGILTGPGGRRDDYYQGLARALAPVCDLFFVRPPAACYWRGMAPERIVELLASALPKARVAADGGAPLDMIIEGCRSDSGTKTLFILCFAVMERGLDLEELLARSRVLSLREVLGVATDLRGGPGEGR